MLLGPDLAALQEGIGDCEATGTRLPSRIRKPVPKHQIRMTITLPPVPINHA